MRRVSFDYGNTCPQIDKLIAKAEAEIFEHIDTILEEACPLLERDCRRNLAETYANSLYRNLEDIFEGTRKTNEDMRREAERQIESLQEEVSNLEHELRSAA